MELYHYIKDNFVLIAGVFAAFKWIYEYSQSRKFEKNKFLLERIEKFNEIEEVKLVHKLLDWNEIKIQYEGIEYIVNDDILMDALKTHDTKSNFTPVEVIIRKVFDRYFDEINEFIILCDCGLIDEINLKRFLKYWIEILNGVRNSKSELFVETIDKYIEFYGYHNIIEFINLDYD